jgi:hypothetical protein
MMMPTTTTTTTNAAAINYNSVDPGRDVVTEKAAKIPIMLDEDEDAWWMMGATGGAILEAPELGLLDHEDEMAIRTKLSFELLPLATVEDSRMDNLFLLDSEERSARAKMAERKKDAPPLDTPPTLQKRLEGMHRQVLDWIEQQPKDKQPRLHQIVRQWAQKLHSELQLEEEEEEGDKKMAAAAVPTAPTKTKKEKLPSVIPPPATAVATVPNGRVASKMESTLSNDSAPTTMESV